MTPADSSSSAVAVSRVETSAVLLLGLLFPSLATWFYFIVFAGQGAAPWVYGVAKTAQFALPVAWVAWRLREPPRLARPSLGDLAEGAGFGLVILVAMLVLFFAYFRTSPVLAGVGPEIARKMADFGIDAPWKFVLMGVFYSLVHSGLEEYYWRWFVFGQLSRRLPLAAAIAISSLGFMGHHVLVLGQFFHGYGPATWFFSLSVAVGGAVWAWLYHRSGNLAGPWLSHLLVDAGLMAIGYQMWTTLR